MWRRLTNVSLTVRPVSLSISVPQTGGGTPNSGMVSIADHTSPHFQSNATAGSSSVEYVCILCIPKTMNKKDAHGVAALAPKVPPSTRFLKAKLGFAPRLRSSRKT